MNSNSEPLEYDQNRLLALQIMLCSRMEELFGALGVSHMTRTSKMYCGPCPVHGGDNPGALNIYFAGESVPGYWRCLSRHCEHTFRKTVIGFVRGVLSRKEYGWSGPNSKRTVTFNRAIEWSCEFLGTKFRDLKIDEKELERRRYIHHIESVVKTIEQRRSTTTRQQCISRLDIPGKYFIKRGWSPEVLKKYDVGTPTSESSPMRDRTVVPVYDDTGSYLLGVTGRSIYERCSQCKMWHNPQGECPSPDRFFDFCKWKNSPGFQRETCLYNYWFSRGHIKRTSTVVLVEGPGDLWRLVEAGVNIGNAMLGTSLSDQQQVILEMSGALNVVSLLNSDQAGRDATDKLREQIGRSFQFFAPKIPAGDLGELPPAEVRKFIHPLLEKICR